MRKNITDYNKLIASGYALSIQEIKHAFQLYEQKIFEARQQIKKLQEKTDA